MGGGDADDLWLLWGRQCQSHDHGPTVRKSESFIDEKLYMANRARHLLSLLSPEEDKLLETHIKQNRQLILLHSTLFSGLDLPWTLAVEVKHSFRIQCVVR